MESHWVPFVANFSLAGMTFMPPKAPVSVTETGRIKPDTEGHFISNLGENAAGFFGQVLYWLPSAFIALSVSYLIWLLFALLYQDKQAMKGRFFGALVFYVMSFAIPLIVLLAESDSDLYVLFVNGLETVRLAGVGAALLAVFLSWRFFRFGFQLNGNPKYQRWSKQLLWTGVCIGFLALAGPVFLP